MEYHRVRSSVPEIAAGFAPMRLEDAQRHRDGVSCRTTDASVIDPYGRERWCIDCNAPLGEEAAWHPDGIDVSDYVRGAFIVLIGVILLMLILLAVSYQPTTAPGPMVTPTTYGPPTYVVGS